MVTTNLAIYAVVLMYTYMYTTYIRNTAQDVGSWQSSTALNLELWSIAKRKHNAEIK